MMHSWHIEARRIFLILSFAIVLGLILGQVAWSLFVFTSLYTCWLIFQMSRIQRWLEQDDLTEPPYSSGIVGHIFDGLYLLQRGNSKMNSRLQNIINRARDSTAALKDAVVMVNSDGQLEWWNNAAERLLGFRAPDDLGQPTTNMMRDPVFKRYYDAEDYVDPIEIKSPVNNRITLQIHITIFRRKERLMLVRDISRVKQLELMRRDFVANVSHELRTPLTVIRGYLETYLDYSDEIPAHLVRALSQMQTQAIRMESLVADLLLLSRLETTQVEPAPDPLKIPNMLADIKADAVALSAGKHTIDIEVDGSLLLMGQEMEIRSAFSNIIFNAVKYTPKDGHIKISWSHNESGANMSVEDDGQGIPEKHIPRLTERFYRADPSRDQETGGTGLGLAIVKHVLMRHNGVLNISSMVGEGSIFTCHFPLDRTNKAPEPEPTTEEKQESEKSNSNNSGPNNSDSNKSKEEQPKQGR